MTVIPIELIAATIRNGRIYFSTEFKAVFPADTIAEDRSSDAKAVSTVLIEAGGIDYHTDIRINSLTRLSPRKSFAAWLKSQRAEAGHQARLVQLGERHFRLEYLGAAA
ncbi:hypothetical protein ACG97_11870 [Vogesella sp. EB]|uniref:hypothetical protein n=1 Tax=Vogesella sp. EB TaxID=1526735 RepID=UPI00064CFB59|nr:hypothetical protein [Vogesella sp. EB]KMJ52759.1 hypothetical protein ACG97_11870 [Vogesella sp. EB]